MRSRAVVRDGAVAHRKKCPPEHSLMKKLVPGMPFSPNEMSRGPDHLIVKTLATIACVKGDRETEITPEWAIMDFKESKKYYDVTLNMKARISPLAVYPLLLFFATWSLARAGPRGAAAAVFQPPRLFAGDAAGSGDEGDNAAGRQVLRLHSQPGAQAEIRRDRSDARGGEHVRAAQAAERLAFQTRAH
jgi:hypothetical protein